MMDRVKLGKITAPQGIKGEVRVYPYTDEQTRFSAVKELEIENVKSSIEKVRYDRNMVILKLSGVDDRNAAEALRGKELYLQRDMLWDIPEDTYFVQDLLGMDVVTDDGRGVGKLLEVVQNTSQDIYVIGQEGGKSFMLPAVKEFVLNVDQDRRVMTVHLIEGMEAL